MKSLRLLQRIAFALAASAALQSFAADQETALPRENHPWGGFPVGSWKLVRTTAETLNSKGQVTNVTVTETRTTLIAADASSYTLRSEIALDVGSGRRIATTPQTVKRGYSGEPPGAAISVKRLGAAPLAVDGLSVPCELKQVAFEDSGSKLVSTLHYSADVAPFVLRRETSIEGGAEEKRNSSLVEVVALDLPQRIRGELKQASYVKTTQKLAQGTKITLEVHCEDVPGSVATHWASETDATGQVVRRSTLELLGYGLPVAASEPAVVMPRRPHRANKAARRMDQREVRPTILSREFSRHAPGAAGMKFIEMTGKTLKRLIAEDELHAGDLDSAGVEDETIVRVNRQGDIEIRRADRWDVIGGLFGNYEQRLKHETGLDWAQ